MQNKESSADPVSRAGYGGQSMIETESRRAWPTSRDLRADESYAPEEKYMAVCPVDIPSG